MTEDESNFRESIWAIRPKWRGLFYGTLSFFGFAVLVLALLQKGWSKSLLEIFDAVWNGIIGSVVVVWFLFQVADWTIPRVKKHIYKFMAWGDPYREALREEARQEIRREARQEGRREAQDLLRKWIESDFRKQGIPEEQIQRFLQQLDALGKIEKKH